MISIVIGKPGSGKSYHIVKYLYDEFCAMARSGITRNIYTNITLNIDEINRAVRKATHTEFDVSPFVFFLSDKDLRYDVSRLRDNDLRVVIRGSKKCQEVALDSPAFFWNRIKNDSLVVIDEIQKYLGGIKEVSDSEKQSLVEYFSLHRHRRQDWIFLTQALMSLTVEVRRVSEVVYEVFNAKSMSLPWPLSIPMRDIDTLFKGFGIYNQVYRVRKGLLDGTYKVDYDKTAEVCKMDKKIFVLYQTHTLSKDSGGVLVSDSKLPFELGKGSGRRAVFWFLRKHFFHVAFNFTIVGLCIFAFFKFVNLIWTFDISKVLGGTTQSSVTDSGAAPQARGNDSKENNDNMRDIPQVDVYDDTIIELDVKPKVISKTGEYIQINDGIFRVGDITPRGRLIEVDARRGAKYEDPTLYYSRLFYELDCYCKYGLQ